MIIPVFGWANASTPEGNKALQYSDLQSLDPQKDTRAAEREMRDPSWWKHGALYLDNKW